MNRESRIVVTGGAGMVGRALLAELKNHHSLVYGLTRNDCDLRDQSQTLKVFQDLKPDYVFHLAAKVGGIQANMADPVGFLEENLLINCHTLTACRQVGVKKTVFLGSSCIYPRDCPQPMNEDHLMSGPLEPTNEGYALSKLAGLKLAEYSHRQYQMQVACPLVSNIYGPGDTFDLARSHVLSALVKRLIDARDAKNPEVTLWGTGKARREFTHVHDVTRALLFFMAKVNTPEAINVGPGLDVSVLELAQLIGKLVGYQGALRWDAARPDGMPRKCMDVSRLNALGFSTTIALEVGVHDVITEYERLRS